LDEKKLFVITLITTLTSNNRNLLAFY